jgi:DNA polymerase elongation subunit (family B)
MIKAQENKYQIDKVPTYALQGSDLEKVIESLKLNQLKYHQFYNVDLAANEQAFHKYNALYGDIDEKYWELKKLNKTYYDIETFFDPQKAPDPHNTEFAINSISFYNNIKNTAYIYFLKDKSHKYTEKEALENVWKIYQESIDKNKTYAIKDLKIELKLFNSEKDLIISFFRKLIELNTLFLIGFNSKLFDDPYTINRLIKLVGEKQAYKIISDFTVKKYGLFNFEQPDYTRVDLLELYKPADSGGSGMGKSLPSYKLDVIAEVELGINKLDLEGNFNEVYMNNPFRFATYNLLDVLLTFKLDEKLGFLELIYSLAKLNHASVRSCIIGRSFIFTYRNNFHYLYDENLAIRTHKFNKEIYRNII